jgi:hypothetical protein
MIRGSLIELRRRCGKPNCRCSEGEPHISQALSYSHNGKTQIITLPVKEIRFVKAALKRYQQALSKLEKHALDGIEELKQYIRRQKNTGSDVEKTQNK